MRPASYALLAISAFVLLGCGQRGPLYMPDEKKIERNELKIDNRSPGTTTDPAKRRSTNTQ